jgi:hypothetical protein
MKHSTHEIQAAINEAEAVIDSTVGRGHRVSIYQHELAVLVATANEYLERRIAEDEERARVLRFNNS